MLKDLILFQKVYDFLKWIHQTVARFPKSERFVLAQRIENTALDLLSAVIEANASREKVPCLDRADLALEKSRIWLRLAFELRYMSIKQYEFGSRAADEIGRMLGGWRRRFGAPAAAGGA